MLSNISNYQLQFEEKIHFHCNLLLLLLLLFHNWGANLLLSRLRINFLLQFFKIIFNVECKKA